MAVIYSVGLVLLSLAIITGGIFVGSWAVRKIRHNMREGEREELKRQFESEMQHILDPMTKEFRSKPRTLEEHKQFFERYRQMFREWAKEYLAQKYLNNH